ncbi:MAG: glycosyltransferase family 2 protein [Vicinamibacterales bacterium]|nr:glycosyltransferase family 2 protein [Vicinamibacterales bacterium]
MPTGPGAEQPLALSAVITTLNEEANLPRCLASLHGLVAEVVVVDSGSTDRTREIAVAAGARFEFRPWPGYAAQKNAAMGCATLAWVLSLDADEAVSPELARSIRERFDLGEPDVDGFRVCRLNFYLGDWIRHAWYPEWRLRLVRRDRAAWTGSGLHERLETTGTTARLPGHLLHYSYRDLRDHLERTVRYARLAAETYAAAGRTARWYHLACSPWLAFGKSLILRQGWRDGWRGWVIAFATLVKVFAKYAFLYERQRSTAGPRGS